MRSGIRSVWALVVVCFIAATGVQPARAAREANGPSERFDTRSSLPAVTAAQPARLLAALRERPAPPSLAPAVLPAPLLVQRFDVFAVLEAARGPTSHAATLFAIRSARGPPAR